MVSEAGTVFAGTNVKLTSEGLPYLGSAIGSNSYVKQFVNEKVKGWSADVTQLAKIAQSQPHAAYSTFNKGLAIRWIYVLHTVPGIADLLQPLEDVIRFVFIPALTGRAPPNDIERNLFALPPRWSGLGLCNPVCLASQEYDASLKITEPLCNLLLSHDQQYPEVKADQLLQKSTVRSFKQQRYSRNSSDLQQQLSSSLQLAVNLATEKGASLTTLPLKNTALLCTSLYSRMLLLCAMVGSHFSPRLIVLVDLLSLLIMLCRALRVGCPQSDIMK